MNTITIDTQMLQTGQLFEKITRARLKSCFADKFNNLVFIVDSGQLKKALGKELVTLNKLKNAFKQKKFRLIEYSDDVALFIKNVVRPIKLEKVVHDAAPNGDIYTMVALNHKDRGLLIGRNAQNLRNAEDIVKKFFDIVELKVTLNE